MSISKKTIRDIDLKDKRVLMRVDFNVPMKDGIVQDDTRIKAALPSINYVLEHGASSLVLMSHLGDPKKDIKKARDKAEKDGKAFDEKKFSDGKHKMAPVSEYLSKLIGKKVAFAPACRGEEVEKLAAGLSNGGILMLENTRFNKEETSKEASEREALAKDFAKLGDIYVNDAFGTAHRAHASTETAARFLPAVAGFLMEKELEYLDGKIVKNPARPFVAIIGGAKVSSKIAVLESLLGKVDKIIIGGGMAYTFLKSKGINVGKSLIENDMIDTAKAIIAKAIEKKVEILLPEDHLASQEFSAEAASEITSSAEISDNAMGMDIGPKTLKLFTDALSGAKTVFWNGPMGVFEFKKFSEGTYSIAKTLANLKDAVTVIGGGDSVSAVNKAGVASSMSHISTGGGASLELVEGKVLPGVAALNDR
jgi:phosphoglycerate kinase